MNERYFCLLLLGGCFSLCSAQLQPFLNTDKGNKNDTNLLDEENEIQKTIDFLKDGNNEIEILDNYRDIVLVLGNTGTGKSTLTRFITKKLSDLLVVDSYGEFIITYPAEDVIANTTTISKTIYPTLVFDETKVPFYDCPGYDDTRNSSIEIATTYFIKRVVDHAKSIKFVLTANYESVHVGGHRTDFIHLVEHFYKFVKNISHYNESITLVATKVENQPVLLPNGTRIIRSDEEMTSNIAHFLDEYRNTLKTEEATNYSLNAIALLDILLKTTDNGKTFKKIGLFRKPEQAGTLDKMNAMVEGRLKLRDIVTKSLVYTATNGSTFGYSLSADAKLKLIDLANEINKGITRSVQNIGNEIQADYKAYESQLGNFQNMNNHFQLGYTQLSSIVADVASLSSEKLIAHLVNASNVLSVPISHEHLNDILTQQQYLTFLQNFTDTKLPSNPNDWVTGLRGCTSYLEDSKNWYQFLANIYDQYSEYEFRKDLTKYNVSDVNDWGQVGKRQGILINSTNFKTFVQKQSNAALIANQNSNDFKEKVLNALLRITLIQTPTATCDETNTILTVKGDYVRLNEVNITQCGTSLRKLQIFAVHTVFIDSDIDGFGKRLDIAILAPRWYIQGSRTFNLTGIPGEKITAEAPATGNRPNATADGGVPGLPGGNAGNFVGLGLQFTNGENLRIIGM